MTSPRWIPILIRIRSPWARFSVEFFQRCLNLNRALDRSQRAAELDQEGVANGVDFPASIFRQKGPDKFPLLIEKPHGKRFISLSKRGETNHVREHKRGESCLIHTLLFEDLLQINHLASPIAVDRTMRVLLTFEQTFVVLTILSLYTTKET